jgi:hypothetical protein
MNRLITLAAIASIAFAAATPVFAQGRFGNEAKERLRDREEREAIRRAEHPELYEKPAPKRVEAAPAQEAAAPTQAATEPVAAAPATPAPAQ